MRPLMLLLSLALSVLAQPRALIERTVVEVGRVKKGEVISVEFRIRNGGTEVLKIESITPA